MSGRSGGTVSFIVGVGVWIALAMGGSSSAAFAEAHDLIICGSGGTEIYKARFADWGRRLRDALAGPVGHPPANVRLMIAPGEGSAASKEATSLASIEAQFSDLARALGNDDDLYVYLIGHGSYIRRDSKFQIPGPDLTAARLGELLGTVDAGRIIVINASSSSAGFINELSAPGRIICTATKSTNERNAPRFMELFIAALEDGSADLDRDERITVWEACTQAARLTGVWYVSEGLIQTEHALLDDDGDGLGTRLAREIDGMGGAGDPHENESFDGELAANCYLKDFTFPAFVPAELTERYLTLLDQIEKLKEAKPGLDRAEYYARLEVLLFEAAKANREIREMIDPEAIEEEVISTEKRES